MNNEEKILSMLEVLTTDMNDMKIDMNGMKTDMKDVKDRLTNLEDKVLITNMTIENEIKTRISFLIDGHKIIWDKIDNVEKMVEEMAPTVLALDIHHILEAQNKR